MKVTIGNGYDAELMARAEEVIMAFERSADMLHNGRNTIKAVQLPSTGEIVVVKCYKKPNFFQRIGSVSKGSKCMRAFRNAQRLLSLGFDTPQPIMAIEDAPSRHDYLVTRCDNGVALWDLMKNGEDLRQVAESLAKFTYKLHEAGVVHCDYNNTNIRVCRVDGRYHFSLIDVNRMDIGEKAPFGKRVENLMMLSGCDDFFACMLRAYLKVSGEYSDAVFAKVVRSKRLYDLRYTLKKRTLHPFRHFPPPFLIQIP